MAFSPELDEPYDQGIYPAAAIDCGLRVVRTDKLHDNGIVNDLMFGEIRGCEVVIADVTRQRNGVYFEAGFALGLGKIVIWSCHESDLANVHFDTRQYSHVVWGNSADLRTKLRNRIKATVPTVRSEQGGGI